VVDRVAGFDVLARSTGERMATTDIDATYRTHFLGVRARCRRMLKSSALAEDVAQETFLRLVQAQPRLEHGANVLGWLRQTSTRLSIDALRALRPQGADVDTLASREPSPEAEAGARAELSHVMHEAPKSELEAVVLVRDAGLTHAEAASELGVSERTLRRRMKRFDARFPKRAVWLVPLLLALTTAFMSARSCSAETIAPEASGVGR
jgi:RNA polymerase sigma factor (sigma-70 family)